MVQGEVEREARLAREKLREANEKRLSVGQAVLARYDGNDEWYRGDRGVARAAALDDDLRRATEVRFDVRGRRGGGGVRRI